ncbi:MAG TPA: hypothetical protein VFA75_04630 [Nevskia sp.]|nr:hypothetical protein [Nevskia sp.]
MRATAGSWKREPFTEGVALAYRAEFSAAQFERLREGLVPREMEDKWFVYYDEPCLYWHRSWSGKPVYRLRFAFDGGMARVVDAQISRALGANEAELAHQAQMLDFLICNLMLGQSKPFPRPPGLNEAAPGVFQHHIAGTGYPERDT